MKKRNVKLSTLVSEIRPLASNGVRMVQPFLSMLNMMVSCLQLVSQRSVSSPGIQV